jgi:chromate reductase
MRVLGIAGSLRRDSHNRALLRAAAAELAAAGAQLELWDRVAELPHYAPQLDVEPAPPAVADLRQAIADADALLISTPEYNASIPGALKNAIDWASRPWPDNALRGKPVAVMGATEGLFGAVWAQAELRKVLDTVGARVLDGELPVGQAHDAFDADGSLRDPALRAALADRVGALLGELREPLQEPA